MSGKKVTYPHIRRVNEVRVDYFDQECGHVWLATFEDVYEDHVQCEVSTPWGCDFGTICVEDVELNSAEDYKKLLTDLGYYEYD